MAGAMIEYAAGGGTMEGYLALPAAEARNGKGVLVLQEWWGLVPHIKDVADRFAAEGYVALAPDFWDGRTAKEMDEAARLFMALEIDRAAARMRGAVVAMRERGGVSGPVGAVGFCMGGQLALYAATTQPDEIGAAVDFYGIHPHVKPDFSRLRAPVLAIFGERDPHVPPSVGEELERAVRAAGGSIERVTYPADHAFFNDSRTEVYDAACAADAWKRVLGFFDRHLH